MKTCSKCQRELPESEYRRGRICIECERKSSREYMQRQRQENPDLVKEWKQRSYYSDIEKSRAGNQARYQRERERRLAYAVKYRAANKERLREWHQAYYRANREKRLAKDRNSYQRHYEKRKETRDSYRERNRITIRLRNRSRKLALAFSRGDFSPQDWERCLAYWGNACAVCGTTGDVRSIAADHWIPLFAGGKTDKLNIIPLCHGIGGCNNRKNKKMPDIWLAASMSADGAQSVLSRVAAYFESIA